MEAFTNFDPSGINPVKKYFFLNAIQSVDFEILSVSMEEGFSDKASNSSSSVSR